MADTISLADKKEKIAIFKRFLKEMGVYTLWLCERKKHIHNVNMSNMVLGDCRRMEMWDCVSSTNDNLMFFPRSLISSFCWAATKTPKLWGELYRLTVGFQPGDILENKIEIIKKEVKHFIKRKKS